MNTSHRHVCRLIYSSTARCSTISTPISQLEKQTGQKWGHQDVTLVLIPVPGHLTTGLNFSTKEKPEDKE